MTESVVMATLALADCPLGLVLNRADPDDSVERAFFADWQEPYREPIDHQPSYRAWQVIDDDDIGARVLQHDDKRNSGLLTGDPGWTDYSISAKLRQILATTLPNTDDEFARVARTGLVFRQQTTRRFYFFGAEGHGDFVLYRREDDRWIRLGHAGLPVDRARYYDLAVRVRGDHIRCRVDGVVVINTRDSSYPAGPCGLITNTVSRCAALRVTMPAAAHQTWQEASAAQRRAVAARSATWPGMRLLRRLDFPGHSLVGLGRHPASATPTLLLRGPGDPVTLEARDLDGRTLWRRALPSGRPAVYTLGDLHGDGATDLLAICDGRMWLIDGAGGADRATAPVPPVGPAMGPRGARADAGHSKRGFIPAALRLQPAPSPRGLVFREDGSPGANTIWGYDADLNPLWITHVSNPRYGHNLCSRDLDGDGRDSFLLGSYLFGPDGQIRWRLEGSDYWERFNGARHVDGGFIAALGPAGDTRLDCVLACGAEGIAFADPATGRIRAEHLIGHVQTVMHGRFLADLPGRQIWAFNRHGNFGICTLYDRDGQELYQCQPHYELYRGLPVTWHPDPAAPQLLFMLATHIRGLYDARMQRLVELPAELPPDTSALVRDLDGDGRDELLFRIPGALLVYGRA